MLRKTTSIEDYILKKIAAGELNVGDKLPSQNMLTRHFDCSRDTVVRALAKLQEGGYIVQRRGSGTFVNSAEQSGKVKEIIIIGESIVNIKTNPFFLNMVSLETGDIPTLFKTTQNILECSESIFHPGQAIIWVCPSPHLLVLMEHLRRRGFPQLLINRDYGKFDTIFTSPEESMREGISWLLIEGGRDMAFVSEKADISLPYIQERMLAFYETCFSLRAHLLPDFIFKSDFKNFFAEIENIGRTLFDRPKVPGSIFVMTHYLVTPLLMCATRYGKKLGKDFCLLSFDEVPELEGKRGSAILKQPMLLFRHETEKWIRQLSLEPQTPFRRQLKCDLIVN